MRSHVFFCEKMPFFVIFLEKLFTRFFKTKTEEWRAERGRGGSLLLSVPSSPPRTPLAYGLH